MSTELEKRVIEICEISMNMAEEIPMDSAVEEMIQQKLMCIKMALTEKENTISYALVEFNGTLEFILINFPFTADEKGIIITTLLKHNAKIIESEPYSYMMGIKDKESCQESINKVKATFMTSTVIFDSEKERLEKRLEKEIVASEIERQQLVQKYSKVLDFLNKKQKPTYQEIYSLLKSLKMPSSMIKIFLSYQGYEKKKEQTFHFESFKKTVIEEPKRSKKELKIALQKYQAMESFDYANYEDVVGILRELNYPETQITNVMYDLFNKATMNYAYYKYIYEKYAMLNPNDPTLKEILDMASAMMIPESIEDYIFWKEQILMMLDNIKGEAKTNETYDLKRVYRTKK